MVDPTFRSAPGNLTVVQLQALALHYVSWRQDPATSLRDTSERLGRSAQTMTTTWDALETHYGAHIFERRGPSRSGRLTGLGEFAGLHALHFVSSDYLVRNAGRIAELGDSWASEYLLDYQRQVDVRLHLISIVGGKQDTSEADRAADNE